MAGFGEVVELSEVPYLDGAQLGLDRFLASLTFYDGDWHIWAGTQDGKFVKIRAWPAESLYFGSKPEKLTDLSLAFLDFMGHRASFIELKPAFAAIRDDILNLSAAFAKLQLIYDQKGMDGAHRMAATEVEYIFLLCRGIFDFLQEIVAKIWEKITLTDKTVNKRQLKKSFADMALRGSDVRSATELMKTFGLPDSLSRCYERQAPVFVKIRQFRDNLVHRGYDVQTIFRGNKGFLIQKRLGPFLNPNIWRDEEAENHLVPLLPALALVVHATLAACEEFSIALASNFKLLEPMVPNMHLFLRSYFNEAFVAALTDANERVLEGRGLLPAAPSSEGSVKDSSQPQPGQQ